MMKSVHARVLAIAAPLLALVSTEARAQCAVSPLRLPPDTPVSVLGEGNTLVASTAKRASQASSVRMRALDNGSVDAPEFSPIEVRAKAVGEGDDVRSYISFTTGAGKKLTVAADQLLLDTFGRAKPAKAFKLGGSIVKADGTFALIRTIESKPYYGPLVQFTARRGADDTVVVESQGFLVALSECAASAS